MTSRPTGPSPEEIDAFLAWTLVRVGHGVEQVLVDGIGRHGLTTRQFGVLALLHSYDDLTQSDLARAVLVRVQSIGPLLVTLETRGLVSRRGPGGRGRPSHFDLTESGRDVLHEAWSAVTRSHDHDRLGLDEQEAQQLRTLLGKVLARIGNPGSVEAEDEPGILRAPAR